MKIAFIASPIELLTSDYLRSSDFDKYSGKLDFKSFSDFMYNWIFSSFINLYFDIFEKIELKPKNSVDFSVINYLRNKFIHFSRNIFCDSRVYFNNDKVQFIKIPLVKWEKKMGIICTFRGFI